MLVEAASATFTGEMPTKAQLRKLGRASAEFEQPLIQGYLNMHKLLCGVLGFEGAEAKVLFGADENGKLRVTTEK